MGAWHHSVQITVFDLSRRRGGAEAGAFNDSALAAAPREMNALMRSEASVGVTRARPRTAPESAPEPSSEKMKSTNQRG
jgi:hypothetical protein